MGLFSSTKTYISSSSTLLIEDTPDLLLNSLTISLMNNRSITDDLLDNYLNGMAMKSSAMRQYAKKSYYYGLPNGSVGYSPTKTSMVKIVLDNLLDINCLIDFNVVDECDATYFAQEYLQNNKGWDRSTGIVSSSGIDTTETVYFDYATTVSTGVYRIYYTYGSDTSYEDITDSNFVPTELYYHVGYYILNDYGDADGELQYWFYMESSDVHSTLTLNTSYVEESPYYPIIPLRSDGVDLTIDTTTDLYKTSKTCLAYLGSDIDDLADAINENDDIDDVDHTYVMFGVNIQSDVQNSIVYLHDYFTYLGSVADLTSQDYIYWQNNDVSTSNPPTNTVTISDDNYKMVLSYNYITTELVTGSIGDIGYATRTNTVLDSTTTSICTYENSYITFRKQVTDTQYQETIVMGPQHVNYVYSEDLVTTTLEDSVDDDDDLNNFIIPVHYNIAKAMGYMAHNYLIYDAYRLVFNTKIKYKLKWYQTSIFKLLITIVSIAITIYTLGSMASSVLAAATITAAIETIATQLVIGYALSVAADYAVDHLGITAAIVAAIVAMAVSKNTKIISMLPDSLSLMQVSNSLYTAVDTEFADQTSSVYTDIESIEEDLETLEELTEDLTEGIWDDPLELLNSTYASSTTTIETPTTFYNRTIHYGNIGVLSLDTIGTFVDDNLSLDMPSSQIRLTI